MVLEQLCATLVEALYGASRTNEASGAGTAAGGGPGKARDALLLGLRGVSLAGGSIGADEAKSLRTVSSDKRRENEEKRASRRTRGGNGEQLRFCFFVVMFMLFLALAQHFGNNFVCLRFAAIDAFSHAEVTVSSGK